MISKCALKAKMYRGCPVRLRNCFQRLSCDAIINPQGRFRYAAHGIDEVRINCRSKQLLFIQVETSEEK